MRRSFFAHVPKHHLTKLKIESELVARYQKNVVGAQTRNLTK